MYEDGNPGDLARRDRFGIFSARSGRRKSTYLPRKEGG